jgi:hypothetical protein
MAWQAPTRRRAVDARGSLGIERGRDGAGANVGGSPQSDGHTPEHPGDGRHALGETARFACRGEHDQSSLACERTFSSTASNDGKAPYTSGLTRSYPARSASAFGPVWSKAALAAKPSAGRGV